MFHVIIMSVCSMFCSVARRRGGSLNHRSAPFPSGGSSSLQPSIVHEVEPETGAASWLPFTSQPPQSQPPQTTAARAMPPQPVLPKPPQPLTDPSGFFQAPSKVTIFTTTSTLGRKPVFFIPSAGKGLAAAAAAPVSILCVVVVPLVSNVLCYT